jgi:hypothetical protein
MAAAHNAVLVGVYIARTDSDADAHPGRTDTP